MRYEVLTTTDEVRAEVRRRILDRYSLEDQMNAIRAGDGSVDFAWIDAMRAAGKQIRRMAVIPHDFADNRHWPKAATPRHRSGL